MNCIALIVAGGIGSRVGADVPKQYVKILGKTIMEYTLQRFIDIKAIDAIKVVIGHGHEEMYGAFTKSTKVLPYTFGGNSRQESVKLGLLSLKELSPKKVLIHDAARPFVSKNIINEVIGQLEKYKAVDVGREIDETVKIKPQFGIRLLDRSQLYGTQTPQGFDYEKILELHLKAKEDVTDDVTLAINAGIEVGFVKGSSTNFKITNKTDLQLAEMLIGNKIT